MNYELMKTMNNDRGQGIISRYVWLIETILKAKKISFSEINRLWTDDTDISGGLELPKRTFDNWRYAIQDVFGLFIENENRGEYRYFIMNADDIRRGGLRSWLYEAFCVGNALAGSQSIRDRILLENVPSGKQNLKPVVEAMKANRVLNITYYNYWKDQKYTFDVQPYCVKLYRQRWYMVAMSTHPRYRENGPRIYCLDRMSDVSMTDESFSMPKDWSAEEFFDGCFGIIAEQWVNVQTVKLKVTASQANYIRDLPMHPSQQEEERGDEYSIFTFQLRPTFDFQQELLWNGEDIEVLAPQWLREEIAGKIKRMYEKYSANM